MRERSALVDALRGVVGIDQVLEGDGLSAYEVDWRGRYHGQCLAVVRPGSTAEVAETVRLCAALEGRVSLVAQGGNTGLVGGGVPDDSRTQVVLSLQRLRAVRRIDADELCMTAESGCVLQAAQEAAARAGLLFPLGMASEGSCTLGGNLATNAGGTQVLRYGNARELCLGLEVVTAQGEIWSSLNGLRKDNTGYDLRHLFIGSEGTLGVITAATWKLFPQPRSTLTFWASCPGPDAAIALLRRLRGEFDAELTAFEAMGANALAHVRRHFPSLTWPLPVPDPQATAWAVLTELSSPRDESGLRAHAEQVLSTACDACEILQASVAQSTAQTQSMWRLRESIPLAQKAAGPNIKHDIGLPLPTLPQFVREADAAITRLCPGARPVVFGHLGDGNLHYNVQGPPDMAPAEFLALFEAETNRRIYDLVEIFGGTVSAEHGIGQLKRQELATRKSPTHLALMHSIKQALDPIGLLNPGKML